MMVCTFRSCINSNFGVSYYGSGTDVRINIITPTLGINTSNIGADLPCQNSRPYQQ